MSAVSSPSRTSVAPASTPDALRLPEGTVFVAPALEAGALDSGHFEARTGSMKPPDGFSAAPEPDLWRCLLHHNARQLLHALRLAAAFSLPLLLLALAWNYCLDVMAAGSAVDVRFPADDSADVRVKVMRSLCTSCVVLLIFCALAYATLVYLRNLHLATTRRTRLVMVAASVSGPLLVEGPVWLGWPAAAARSTLFLGIFLGLVAYAREMAVLVGRRRFGALLSAIIVFFLAMNVTTAWLVAPVFVDPATGDGARLLWLAVGHTLMLEAFLAPTRWMAREFPGARPEVALIPAWFVFSYGRLMERMLLAMFASDLGVAVAVVVIAARDAVLRHTIAQRDRVLMRVPWELLSAENPHARRQQLTLRCIDEITDLFGMVAAAVFVLVLRVSNERTAPAAWRALGAALAQVLFELFSSAAGTAVAVRLRARGCAQGRAFCEQVHERARLLRQWSTRYNVTATALAAAAALSLCEVAADPGDGPTSTLCAWSKSEGAWGWHRVACPAAEAWLG